MRNKRENKQEFSTVDGKTTIGLSLRFHSAAMIAASRHHGAARNSPSWKRRVTERAPFGYGGGMERFERFAMG